MNVLSLFDGIGCGQEALRRLGIAYNWYGASEINAHAIAVAMDRFPNTIQCGDVRFIGKDVQIPEKIDLLLAGSPCQGFSRGNKNRKYFEDERSGLFYEVLRIMDIYTPTYVLVENVVMPPYYAAIVTEELQRRSARPLVMYTIDSAAYSAQHRIRHYWTNLPKIEPRTDIHNAELWQSVWDSNNNLYRCTKEMEYGLYEQAAKHGVVVSVRRVSNEHAYIETSAVSCIAGMRNRPNKHTGSNDYYLECRRDQKSNALTTVTKDNVVVPFQLKENVVARTFPRRDVNATELERLQTLPDGYTSAARITHRRDMIGNGWTVNVICDILKELQEHKKEEVCA